MPYGTIKIDTITFTDGGVDKSVPVSGLILNPTFTGNVTVTGTISGNIIQGGTTVSGLTVTGTTANFASGVFTTQISGVTITGTTVAATTGTFTSLTGTTTNGTTASFTTGNFTSLTGTTTTGTTANFASGVFTTRVSGLLITGPTVSATTGNFTSLTGTTTTGTTANFASGVFTTQISGVTITGTTISTTTGNFTSLTGTTATITSGIIASGTAALPSLAILSDPNTGIYSPGADQLAVATNGTQRLTVDTAATTSTLPVVHPLGAVGTPSLTFTGDLNTGIFSPGADQVAISTNGVQRLSIGSTGNIDLDSNTVFVDAVNNRLGIGTSSPNYELHVNASDATNFIQLTNSGTGTGVSDGFLLYNNGVNATVSNQEAGYLAFETSGQNRIHILSDGKVGIGTSSPSSALDVSGAISLGAVALPSAGTARIFSRNTDSNLYIQTGSGNTLNLLDGSQNTMASFGSSTVTLQTGNSPRLSIDSSGRVGIGVTSPAQALEVNGNIQVGDTASSAARIDFGSASARIQHDGADNLSVFSNGSERARIDSSGRLLVGTIASPAHQLQVSTDSAGKPSTNTWTIVSDERIKEEIELADLDLCYEAVKIIPLKRFKWKDEVYTQEQVRDRRKLGWIAQDVEAVFPKAVGTYQFKYNQVFEETIIPAVEEELDDDGNVTTPAQPERIEKGELISEDVIEDCRDLNSDQLYAAMYGAIQKLMAKVEALEAEVATLKAQ